MPRITRSLKKQLEKLRNIPEDISGSETDDDDGLLSRKKGKQLAETDENVEDSSQESDKASEAASECSDDDEGGFESSSDEDGFESSGDEGSGVETDGMEDDSDEMNEDEDCDEFNASWEDIDEANNEDEENFNGDGEENSDSETSDEVEFEDDETVWEVSVDKNVWKKHYADDTSETVKGRLPVENVMRVKPGPTTYAIRKASDILNTFGLFIDDNILDHICKCTTTEARRRLQDENWTISKDELLAFIAICYARGALGMKNMSVTNIFSRKYGPVVIRSTMSRDKFKTIMRFLRFDIKETRSQRLATDKFALMSYVWNAFIENCTKCYNPDENITVDEQLFPTKTRCPFTQFMKDKPDKFGIKFYLAVDVDSKYILNGFPYTGRDEENTDKPHGEAVVLELMKPYFSTGGYNVTADNFFTGVDLAISLKEKNITFVGTANKKRRWLPATAKMKNPKLPLYDTNIYLGPNGTTLTLYQCKRNKSVSILSSLHKSVKITRSAKKKPETIHFYNQTKYGVDVADQMAKKYSSKAASRRWPVQVFYNILDLAGLNAWIIYKSVTGKNISRLDFLMQLVESLRRPYLANKGHVDPRKIHEPDNNISAARSRQQSLQKEDKSQKRKSAQERTSDCACSKVRKRQHCQVKKCNNKSSDKCYGCKKYTCGKCTSYEQRWCIECCPHVCSKRAKRSKQIKNV